MRIFARRSDNSGSVVTFSALLIPILIAGLSIGVDVSYWRHRTSQLQMAADGAAMSAALDIGNNILTAPMLLINAQNEVQKYGCASNCTVALAYPYASNPDAVRITVTDTNATRFFSFLYENSVKVLQAQSIAARYSAGTAPGGVGSSGSACILALGTGGNGNGIRLQNPQVVVESGCELVANAQNSQAIYVENGPRVRPRASTRGQISIMNMNGQGGVDNPNPNISAAISDPYAGRLSSVFNHSNFSGAPYPTGQCIERLSDPNNPVTLNFGAANLAADINNAAGRGYSYDATTRTHTLAGGGGRFCMSLNVLAGTTLNFGPGLWFFSQDINLSGVINATSRALNGSNAPTQAISSTIPGVPANTMIDGSTIVWGRMNVNLSGGAINVHAPTMGPSMGVAVMAFLDYTGQTLWEFANGAGMQWQGVFYAPTIELRVQNNSGLIQSLPPVGGSAIAGCSQIVVRALTLLNDVTLGNLCAQAGVQAFGTDVGWFTPASGGGGSNTVKARLRSS